MCTFLFRLRNLSKVQPLAFLLIYHVAPFTFPGLLETNLAGFSYTYNNFECTSLASGHRVRQTLHRTQILPVEICGHVNNQHVIPPPRNCIVCILYSK